MEKFLKRKIIEVIRDPASSKKSQLLFRINKVCELTYITFTAYKNEGGFMRFNMTFGFGHPLRNMFVAITIANVID